MDEEGRRENSKPSQPTTRLPRSQKKKLKRLEAIKKRHEHRKEKKMDAKKARQFQATQMESAETDEANSSVSIKQCRRTKERMSSVKDRCEQALVSGQRICIDCGLESHMSDKECSKLAQQIGRLYGANKRSPQPVAIHLTSFNPESRLYKECMRVNSGFQNYILCRHKESLVQVFKKDELVYMSPNANEALDTVDPDRVYVIGGLVDETIQKKVSKNRAEAESLVMKRLPVDEFMKKAPAGSHFSQVLAVNQVFEALLSRSTGQAWPAVLVSVVPQRKGYVPKDDHNI